MTRKELTSQEKLDAAWRARVPARAHLDRMLEELEKEVTHQRKMCMGRWGSDLDSVLELATAAHAAQAELNRIDSQIAALQDLLRPQWGL